MWNSKLQAALDELGRLHDTVREYKARNGKLPSPDSDAGRAMQSLQLFQEELDKLAISRLLHQ
jgi:major membrane immunogen (membrane-anchored lipoprotein)